MIRGNGVRRRVGVLVGVLGSVVGGVLAIVAAPTVLGAEDERVVPVPTVELVPEAVGDGPQSPSHTNPAKFGYVEEEFFISGTAKSFGATPADDAPYKTRLVVLRPEDTSDFNGTVLAEWNNVSGQIDASPVWYLAHEYLIREGYIFVGVTAQQIGQDGAMGLKQRDGERYDDLEHPGDDYSWDIFSQAGQAVLAGGAVPSDYEIERMMASGQSQSGGRLGSYLRQVHPGAWRTSAFDRRVYDGVMPMTADAGIVPDNVGPIVWVNEVRNNALPADGTNFRGIEIAGAPHFSWWGFQAGSNAGWRDGEEFDRDSAAQYGERGGGPCPQGFFPDRFAYHAAIDHMDHWLRTGEAPNGWPRIERQDGRPVQDEFGNVRDGFRLPAIDVPVATYVACGLFGATVPIDPARMAQLYPDHDVYVEKMAAAVTAAKRDGRLLGVDAKELMERAERSAVGRDIILVAGP